MTTKELRVVLSVLKRVGPVVNPFRDEAVAYVEKDLAIREQQSNDMREMNKDNRPEYDWPFYGQ
jgi:hypothetical protein